jgi:hypothetical protein
MSDHSIAAIARALASALLAAAFTKETEREQEKQRVDALERELCDEYRAEVIETLKV